MQVKNDAAQKMTVNQNSSQEISEILFCSQKEIEDFAALLAQNTKYGTCFALHGGMGVGKSTFARAFIRSYCQSPTLEVPSPTFALVQNYGREGELFHYDLWRLEEGASLEELDWIAAESGIMLVEWPEHAGDYLPLSAVHLFLSQGEGSAETAPRRLSWQAPQKEAERLNAVRAEISNRRSS